MKTRSRVSLREIAEKAGVSRMAVSLALRGKSGVSEQVRKKITTLANQMGYTPDPQVARMLSHIRSQTGSEINASLAMLTSGPEREVWKRFITERKYVEGAKARAREYGYQLGLFWLNEPGLSASRLSSILWNRGIEGVLIAPLQQRLSSKTPRSIDINFDLFSAVEISETIEQPNLNRAVHDHYTSMLTLLEKLRTLKYQRPGLVLEEALDLRVNGKWSAAYLFHNMRTRLNLPPLLLPELDQNKFDRWFNKHHPDVIISVDHFGYKLLEQTGLSIPEEIGYCSLDTDGDADDLSGVSGINQNSEMLGVAAVDLVVGSIQRGQRGIPVHPLRIQIEGSWVDGNSICHQ